MRILSFFYLLLVFTFSNSCVAKKENRELFDVRDLSYQQALKNGFKKVNVDVELLERHTGNFIIAVTFTNDRETLLEKSWRFPNESRTEFIDSLVYSNNMNYLTLPCNVDSVRRDFVLIDKARRIFVGRIFKDKIDSYTEIVFYVPNSN